jgi:hypothetical protein
MIKGLMGTTGVVIDGASMSLPYVNTSGDTFQGLLRIANGDYQYYSNGAWNTLPTAYPTVRLDGSADAAIQWVNRKMGEEYKQKQEREQLERKSKEHPSLTKAWEAIIKAEEASAADVTRAYENFRILEKIIGEESNNDEVSASSAP